MKKKFALWLIVAFSVFGLAGCAQSSGNVGTDLGQILPEPGKNASYQNITPEAAKQRLDTEAGIILLDVRTVEEYTEKHIPGSRLIPVDVIETEAPVKLTDKNAEIFVYCRSGNRSVTASQALVELGYTNVYNLGGIKDWPYETEAGAPR